MPNPLTISLGQFLADDNDPAANHRRALDVIEVAAQRGSHLCILPEVWTGTGFSATGAHEHIAETIPGPSTDLLCEAAARHGMTIVGSLYERAGEHIFNTAPVIGPDGTLLGSYRKTHLFDVPNRVDMKKGIRESDKVAAGNALQVYDLGAYKLGVAICSDLRFPEIFRTLRKAGADLIAVPTAFISPRLDHWEVLLRARALDNQVFIAASGMIGREPVSGIGFVARSMVVDPWGIVLATAPDMQGCTTAHLDLEMVNTVQGWWPLLDQLRPDLYSAGADLHVKSAEQRQHLGKAS